MALKTTVLIVGASPVGLVLAKILKHNKINVIIIDKNVSKLNNPQPVALNQETLDIFETLGLTTILNSGLAIENIHCYSQQKYIGQFNFKAHPCFFHIAHNELESHLEDDLQRRGLSINRGTELISYSQHKSGVIAQVNHEGTKFFIQADFLIGCDGENSKVRELMNCGTEQRDYGSSFILTDAYLTNYKEKNARYFFNQQGSLLIIPLPKNKYRLVFSFPTIADFSSKQYLSDKNLIQNLIKELTGYSIEILTIFWRTSSNYGYKISNQIVQNRVVLAGNAIHQFSSVGDLNINLGIQDAYALGWRLVQAINSLSPRPYLLEYDSERRAITDKQQLLTGWITAFITRKNDYSLTYKNRQKIKGYLTGLANKNNSIPYQNFLNDEELNNFSADIRYEFLNANYVFFTCGKLSGEILEKIENWMLNKPFLTWIHSASEKPIQYYLYRPDALVILSGNSETINQLAIRDNGKTELAGKTSLKQKSSVIWLKTFNKQLKKNHF